MKTEITRDMATPPAAAQNIATILTNLDDSSTISFITYSISYTFKNKMLKDIMSSNHGGPMGLSEVEYRSHIQAVYDEVQRALENIDPDQVECEQSLGSLTLTFGDRSKCILSAQPSVKQLWLALASQGKAFHFNFDLEKKCWLDDRGLGIELKTYLKELLQQVIGRDFHF